MRRLSRNLLLILVLISVVLPGGSFIIHTAAAAQGPSAKTAGLNRPRLVLLIVIDQFRYDYLERFGDLFGSRGIGRLMKEGAFWTNANYDHTPTVTAVGHAAIMTGAPPAGSGIVGNEWIDRQSATRVTSVTDNSVRALDGGAKERPYSPRLLLASTVGDELRAATGDRAKVIGISGKPRSAILPAGRRANAAYWISSETGTFVSSSYYFPSLPEWVTKFNSTRPADLYFNARWERLLPEAEYLKHSGPDAPQWENIGKAKGDTNAFPHLITGGSTGPDRDFYTALDHSPFLNQLIVSFATQAIKNEEVGQDGDTDVLTVSLSANDYIGHRFGRFSQEVMDAALRADREIGILLDFVEERVGLRNSIIVFTGDHGVAPLPEHAAALGLDGANVPPETVLKAIRDAISARYNAKRQSPDPTADYILKYDNSNDALINGNLYFNLAALRRDGINFEQIQEVAGKAALQVSGIARYFTRSKLERGSVSKTDPIAQRVLHGFYRDRSGDVIIIPKPFGYLSGPSNQGRHGSPYSYDTHVPLIIMGESFRPGRYRQTASPADVAPTLAAVLGIQRPASSSGRVLSESLKMKR